MGCHPDRNAQFQNGARLRQEYQAATDPVISIATKKTASAQAGALATGPGQE